MAQQTICPACGAPLTYTGTAEQIRCPFCDTELEVLPENGQERFRILSQPGPQKEVLSRPVEGGQSPAKPSERTTDQLPVVPPAPSTDENINTRATTVIQREDIEREALRRESLRREETERSAAERDSLNRSDIRREDLMREEPPPEIRADKQPASGSPGFTANEASRPAFSQERPHSQHSAETVSVPETSAFYQMHGPAEVPVTGTAEAAPRRRSNWLPVVLALVIGLILFMACAAGAWIMLGRVLGAG